MLLYPTFIPNQIHYIMLGIKLGIKIKKLKLSYKISSFPFAFSGIGFSVSPPDVLRHFMVIRFLNNNALYNRLIESKNVRQHLTLIEIL